MNHINNTIMLTDSKGVSVIDINSIIRVEAISNYSKLFLADGKRITVSKVLKQVEAMLAGKGFERVHRSHLVNSTWIQRYNLYQQKIELYNQEEVSMSRRKKAELKEKLSGKKALSIPTEQTLAAA